MNDAISKKLGEVWAFSRIGLECKQRSGLAFEDALGKGMDFEEKLSEFAAKVEAMNNNTASDKAEKTETKLRGMMEAYIGDDWDDPVEILEWLSFFLGAAAAHWSLIKGAAEELSEGNLTEAASDAFKTYSNYLQTVNKRLKEEGRKRANES